jgi:hypothetical protein
MAPPTTTRFARLALVAACAAALPLSASDAQTKDQRHVDSTLADLRTLATQVTPALARYCATKSPASYVKVACPIYTRTLQRLAQRESLFVTITPPPVTPQGPPQHDTTTTPPPPVVITPGPPPGPVIFTHPYGPPASGTILAEFPRVQVDVTYPTPSRSYRIGANLQQALDTAKAGDELRVPLGSTYTGNYVWRQCPSAWVILRGDIDDAQLGARGTRMTRSRATALALPRIVTTTTTNAMVTQGPACHLWLAGLNFGANNPGNEVYSIVQFGGFAADGQTSLAAMAHDLVLDRSLVAGSFTQILRRCVVLNSGSAAVVDATLDDCHSNYSDSQGILGLNGTGPYRIENNTINAGHQAFMFGGGDPAISGLIPSDIVVRGNLVGRPKSWQGVWKVKTTIELKQGNRVLIEGNTVYNVWADAWGGPAISFKSTNQDGGCPWCNTSDVTFRYNVITCAGIGYNVAGRPEQYPAVPMSRVSIYDNDADSVNVGACTGVGDAFSHYGVDDLFFVHNRVANSPGSRSGIIFDGPPSQRATYVGNVMGGQYSINASGGGGIAKYLPGAVFTANAFVVPGASSCPAGMPTGALCVGSFSAAATLVGSDGRPLGPDQSKLAAARAAVVAP